MGGIQFIPLRVISQLQEIGPFELSHSDLDGIRDSASGAWDVDTEDLALLVVREDGVMALKLSYFLAEHGGHSKKGQNCK